MSYEIAVEPTSSVSFGKTPNISRYSTCIEFSRPERTDIAELHIKTNLISTRSAVAHKPEMTVKRRLNGFFVQEEGDEARVAFVDNGELIHYYLPNKIFAEAGVQAENQPFELDEYEMVVGGVTLNGHKVRPTALARDSYSSPLPIDESRRTKLEFILSRNWNVSS